MIAGGSTRQPVIGLNYGWDGVDWGRMQLDALGALKINNPDLEFETDDDSIAAAGDHQLVMNLLYGYNDSGGVWKRVEVTADHRMAVTDGGVPFEVKVTDGVDTATVTAGGRLQVEASSTNEETDDGAVTGAQLGARVLALGYGWDGSDWSRLYINPGINALYITSRDTESDDDVIAGGATRPVHTILNYGYDGANWERLQTNATGSLYVSSQGRGAHDSAISGDPHRIGATAIDHGTNPTEVAAADNTNVYANRAGVPFVMGGHPNVITEVVKVTDGDGAQSNIAIFSTAGSCDSGLDYCRQCKHSRRSCSCRSSSGNTCNAWYYWRCWEYRRAPRSSCRWWYHSW